LEWLLVIIKCAHEGEHIAALIATEMSLEKMDSFKWFLCYNRDASSMASIACWFQEPVVSMEIAIIIIIIKFKNTYKSWKS